MSSGKKDKNLCELKIHYAEQIMEKCILQMDDPIGKNEAAVHTYEVSQFCRILSRIRGEREDLAAIAGLLHDCFTYSSGQSINHAIEGAGLVRAWLLDSQGLFSDEEIEKVCLAIASHSDKSKRHGPLDEILKDADVLSHHIKYPFEEQMDEEKPRLIKALNEITLYCASHSSEASKNAQE